MAHIADLYSGIIRMLLGHIFAVLLALPALCWSAGHHMVDSLVDVTTIPEAYVCSLPIQSGYRPDISSECLYRWAYYNDIRQCVKFCFNGVGGNRNNFETRLECESTCLNYYDDSFVRTSHKTHGHRGISEASDGESSEPSESSGDSSSAELPSKKSYKSLKNAKASARALQYYRKAQYYRKQEQNQYGSPYYPMYIGWK